MSTGWKIMAATTNFSHEHWPESKGSYADLDSGYKALETSSTWEILLFEKCTLEVIGTIKEWYKRDGGDIINKNLIF